MAQKSKSRSIVGSTLQITIAVLIIKILGVLKQSIVAAFFGANSQTDVYFIATGVIGCKLIHETTFKRAYNE